MIRERYLQVLRYLALNESASKYQMEKRIKPKIDHATLHEAVSDLKRAGLVRVVRTEKFKVKSLKVQYYDLRLMGLMAVLQEFFTFEGPESSLKKEIDQIAEKHWNLLPLILGRWKLLKESWWNPYHDLISSCRSELPKMPDWPLKLETRRGRSIIVLGERLLKTDEIPKGREVELVDTLESYFRDVIYERFFYLRSPSEDTPAPRWMKVSKAAVYDLDNICAKDQEISSWLMKRLEKLIGQYAKYHNLLQERMKRLETLQKRERFVS